MVDKVGKAPPRVLSPTSQFKLSSAEVTSAKEAYAKHVKQDHDEAELRAALAEVDVKIVPHKAPTIIEHVKQDHDEAELRAALAEVDVKIVSHEARKIIAGYLDKGHQKITENIFLEIVFGKREANPSTAFRQDMTLAKTENVSVRESAAKPVTKIGGKEVAVGATSEAKHTIGHEEKDAYASWINAVLYNDEFLNKNKYLKIDPKGSHLYEKCSDGILLCKLINHAMPETVDERALNLDKLNEFRIIENINLMLNSAMAIGCNVVNTRAAEIRQKKEHLVLGLLWQIIRIGLLSNINLEFSPGLARLLEDGETIEDLRRLSPEQILIRWVNYHLGSAGCRRRLTKEKFSDDIKDSEIYTHLLVQIAPSDIRTTLAPLQEQNHTARAELMLQEAQKLECRQFVRPENVATGVYKLNLAFVANLFNRYPALSPPEEEIEVKETREEKTYRNWMNSLGVRPRVNYLYSDLSSGVVLFDLMRIIKPDIAPDDFIVREFSGKGALMNQIANCQKVIDVGKKMGLSLVSMGGKDLHDGRQTLMLGLIWQLMRAYTLKVLASCTGSSKPITDQLIVDWVNARLAKAGKPGIASFQDPVISDAKPVLELIEAIQPNLINWKQFITPAETDEDKLKNAKYAISMSRKLGAKVFALPEDITEVRAKMVMTVFACLMARDYNAEVNLPGLQRAGAEAEA